MITCALSLQSWYDLTIHDNKRYNDIDITMNLGVPHLWHYHAQYRANINTPSIILCNKYYTTEHPSRSADRAKHIQRYCLTHIRIPYWQPTNSNVEGFTLKDMLTKAISFLQRCHCSPYDWFLNIRGTQLNVP